MKKHTLTVCLLLCTAILLCGCRALPIIQVPDIPNSPLLSLYFSESHSYVTPIQGYEYRLEDGKHMVYFELSYPDEPYSVQADQRWTDTLLQFIRQYEMMGWKDFRGSDSHLLDGTQFFCSFAFADGTKITASGYGEFPGHYSEASAAIEAHFRQLLPEDMLGW